MQPTATLLEHCSPEKHRPSQRDEAEEGAQKIIPAIHERVLQPDVKDRDVLRDRAHARARNRNRKMFSAKKAKEKSSCPRNTRKDTKIFRDKRQSVMAAGPCLL